MDAVVRLRDVGLTYQSEFDETLALADIDMDVFDGELVALVGPSGCGKSTLLSIIAGLLLPDAGSVNVLGRPVAGACSEAGYMLQRDHLFDWRTIFQNCMLGLQVRGEATPEAAERVRQMLNACGLGQFKEHYPRELSGGMRQKAALIRTLAPEPKLLLLDEPFSALDYQTRLSLCDEVYGIIRQQHKTAIMVTHDISEAISFADRIFVFSSRPAHIKRELSVALPRVPPLERRRAEGFRRYFDEIWKELDVNG